MRMQIKALDFELSKLMLEGPQEELNINIQCTTSATNDWCNDCIKIT